MYRRTRPKTFFSPTAVRVGICLFGVILSVLVPGLAAAAPPTLPTLTKELGTAPTATGAVSASDPAESTERVSRIFILPAMINVHPKLESEILVKQYFNTTMRLIAPRFKDVRTIGTLRDDYILWTPDFAIGGVVSKYLALYVHMGYSAGKVRTKEHDTSIFVIPLHTDFEIYRSAAYLGLCADIFPFGMPEHRKYDGVWDRLRHTKPSIGFRVTETYASYRAKVKCGFTDVTRFLDLELTDDWWVTTLNANLGADVPINEYNALSLNAGYNVALTRGYDFDGPAFTVGWKHYFKKRSRSSVETQSKN